MEKEKVIPKSKLLEKTKQLYKSRSILITHEVICDKTGLGHAWLANFCNVEEPSVTRIEALYEFLSGKSLEV